MKNLIIRGLTGAVFVAILVGGVYYNPYTFLVLFSILTGLLIWEFHSLLKEYFPSKTKRIISTAGGIYLFASAFAYSNGLFGSSIFLPYMAFILYSFISELYNKHQNPLINLAFTLLAQLYCAGSFALANYIVLVKSADGEISFTPLFLLALFVFVWINDTGAYLIGSQFGKHRLFERISPKKSWEGFWGGMFFALASSLIFSRMVPEISWYNWLGFATTVVCFGTWGDLVESLIKRTVGVKDSGKMLPGHGGMLDRFDSILLAIPAAYIYIELFIRN
ncbi:MAG: phosphatidate cytidylyltransferase [Porphyromonadaceae bacterium]|nr:phosphatidate cytidylyltransferase [Porphyromonadaceae bacterium]